MNILALPERLDKELIPGAVGQYPEFDLGVVGSQKLPPLFRDKGLPDHRALFGADGDVLEIGLRAGEAARCRDRLVEGGVDPSGIGVHQLRQGMNQPSRWDKKL